MSTTYDDVLTVLVRVCENAEHFSTLSTVCAIRDLRGRIRLIVKPNPAQHQPDLEALTASLAKTLGGYFSPPILSTSGPVEQARLARNILDQSDPWPEVWPHEFADPITGESGAITPDLWRAFQRFISKETWLSAQEVRQPWPLRPQTPAIVSFYSFKGGVGRTLLLAAMSWRLAREGKRVAVIDLDLEAPGLASYLGAASSRGVIDFIADDLATGSSTLDGCHDSARSLADVEGGRIHVFPAGAMNWSYLEKLARLDYAAVGTDAEQQSPAGKSLTTLLKLIKSQLEVDVILIDSRAGLHDLGGLSLHALSHVDVIVARAGEQGHAGLELTLQALVRRRSAEDLRTVLVHSFAPPNAESALGQAERDRFRERAHGLFVEHVYSHSDEDDPQIDDLQAPHYPWVIPRFSELEYSERIESSLETIIFSEPMTKLFQRIEELCDAGPVEDTESADK